jgi:hypothetical protein
VHDIGEGCPLSECDFVEKNPVNKSESEWLAANARPQKYLNRDPHPEIGWDNEEERTGTVLTLIMAFVFGFAVAVLLFVA